jgi:hypothetical protein
MIKSWRRMAMQMFSRTTGRDKFLLELYELDLGEEPAAADGTQMSIRSTRLGAGNLFVKAGIT